MDVKDLVSVCRVIRRVVRQWSRQHREFDTIDPESMQGTCAIASYILHQVLKNSGLKPSFIVYDTGYECHAWVEVKSTVIDLTASQFGDKFPDIYIVDRDKYIFYIDGGGERISGRAALEHLNGWNKQQNPYVHLPLINEFIQKITVRMGQKKKLRNYELALIAKHDPARLRTRTVEPEPAKQKKSRARRKSKLQKTLRNEE